MSPRRYYRSRTTRPKQRYSVENTLLSISTDVDTSTVSTFQAQGIQDLVPALASNIPRKVSHIHLHFDAQSVDICFAVVYVPAGYTPNFLGLTADSPNLYNPNQFLMGSGYITQGGQVNFTIPTKRILHSGDNIRLIIAHPGSTVQVLTFAARYAICAL